MLVSPTPFRAAWRARNLPLPRQWTRAHVERPLPRLLGGRRLALRLYQTNHHKHSQTAPSPRKPSRTTAAKASLQRAAKEAHHAGKRGGRNWHEGNRKVVTAYSAAEQYDIAQVSDLLQAVGYQLDPFHTNLFPHVVHFQYPPGGPGVAGDVFVFPNGTVVAWDVDEEHVKRLISRSLVVAAHDPVEQEPEMEDLEFVEDDESDTSQVHGDLIVLGTRQPDAPLVPGEAGAPQTHQANLALAKIAFSSGLGRSTKVAVLESALERYFASTRDIPTVLSTRRVLPYTRPFILRKTGELLRMRAQLNLSSELTDALPDLFWDSRHELGLEGYFVQVSRTLDVGVRIKTLNEKMNYAQEIASVLQDRLSEKHGLFLEWLIIALISIEVGFEVLRLVKESSGGGGGGGGDEDARVEALLKRCLKRVEDAGVAGGGDLQGGGGGGGR